MVSVKSLLLALALGSEALAAGPSTTCSTKMGTVSVKTVPTQVSTKTSTVTQTEKVIKTNSKTVTPNPTTLTTTVTRTVLKTKTAGAATKTATTIVTVNNEITIPVVIIDATETSTITIYSTSTSTSYVPPPPNFTGVWDISRNVLKRDTPLLAKRQKSTTTPKQYPQRVDCVRINTKTLTKTSTSTVNGKTTTLKPATSIQTATVTTTKTSTKFPADVPSTITSTVTNDVVVYDYQHETATETTTVTVQTIVPVTKYQACGRGNILSNANGGTSNMIKLISSREPSSYVKADSVTDPYSCCVLCQLTSNCQGSFVYQSKCTIIVSNTCTPGLATDNQFKTSSLPFGDVYTISNGPCGSWKNAGHNTPI